MPETIRARFPNCLGLVSKPERASHSARLLTGRNGDAFYGAAAVAYLTMSYAKDGLELPCDDDAFLTCRASHIYFLFFQGSHAPPEKGIDRSILVESPAGAIG
ncbi:hypothetical protein MTO96_044562 [Rhipicephalus appendiculatus]